MADEETKSNETPDTSAPTASGADTGAEQVGSTASDQAGAKPNDGSAPMPRHGELEQATKDGDTATADGDQTGAGTSDATAVGDAKPNTPDASAPPESVLSTPEIKPAAKVGPVEPSGPRTGGGRGRQGGGPQRGGNRGERRRDIDDEGIESSVIRIYRCSKVVKGGRTFSFAALVVAGDRNGQIGIGYGKANEVPSAVEKSSKEARKSLFKFPMQGSTIPHVAIGKSGSSTVKLIPARPGTGVTAGKTVRPVLELAGLSDVLTKAYGSTSPKNLLKATIDALRQLQSRGEVEKRRGVDLEAGAGELQAAAA